MMHSSLSVAIIDDDQLIVDLLSQFFENQEGMKTLFTAHSGDQCIEILATSEIHPDILLLDLQMNEGNGTETAEHIKTHYPALKTIIISSHYQKSFTGFMLRTGVAAFIPKGISPIKLVEIIREVHEKGFYFLDEQIAVIREQVSTRVPKPVIESQNALSEREIDVLRLICLQKTAKEIGEKLFISTRTAESHKNNLFVKTGAKNIAGLAIYAVQNKLINPEDHPIL
jgi:DNA-binding NarL/FixJ family response regulator